MKKILLVMLLLLPLSALGQRNDWNLFIQALIEVESKGNELADDGKGCWGVLQLTDIYVREVNRLYGTSFVHKDAFDREKSIMMFKLMQDAKNPKHDFKKALDIHNPRHPESYAVKVYMEFNRLLNSK